MKYFQNSVTPKIGIQWNVTQCRVHAIHFYVLSKTCAKKKNIASLRQTVSTNLSQFSLRGDNPAIYDGFFSGRR